LTPHHSPVFSSEDQASDRSDRHKAKITLSAISCASFPQPRLFAEPA